jgi:plastocyanin
MFAWNGIRHEGMLSSFEPAAVLADTDSDANADFRLTFGVTPTMVILGNTARVTATVAVTNAGSYTSTWDLDNDGVAETGVGPVDIEAGGSDEYNTIYEGYTSVGTFDSTAVVTYRQTGLITPSILTATVPVTITGPTPVVSPTQANIGESIVVEIDNYVENVITGANIEIMPSSSTPFTVVVEDADIPASGVVDTGAIFNEADTYTITTTLYPADSLVGTFDLNADPATDEVSSTVNVDVAMPSVTFEADPVEADVGETVTFTGTLSGAPASSVMSYTFDFGDSVTTTVSANTNEVSTTHVYDAAGSYTAVFAAMFANGMVVSDTTPVTVSEVVVGDNNLALSVANDTLTAGSGDTTDVVATVTNAETSDPVAGAIVTVTLESPVFGLRLDGTTTVSGTTDASGSYTTTLAVGQVPGQVTLAASSDVVDGPPQTATIITVPESGGASDTQAITLVGGADQEPVQLTVGERAVTIDLATLPSALDGVTLYVNVVANQINATDAPSGTILVADFNVSVFAGQDLTAEISEGDPVTTAQATSLGVTLDGAQVTVSYSNDEIDALGIDPETLAVYDTVSDDGTGDFNDTPLTSVVNTTDNQVTADVEQLGRHALAGQPVDTQMTLYLPLVIQ